MIKLKIKILLILFQASLTEEAVEFIVGRTLEQERRRRISQRGASLAEIGPELAEAKYIPASLVSSIANEHFGSEMVSAPTPEESPKSSHTVIHNVAVHRDPEELALSSVLGSYAAPPPPPPPSHSISVPVIKETSEAAMNAEPATGALPVAPVTAKGPLKPLRAAGPAAELSMAQLAALKGAALSLKYSQLDDVEDIFQTPTGSVQPSPVLQKPSEVGGL